MADFDELRLKTVLTLACRNAFAGMRRKHAGESFYCMGLFTSGGLAYVYPTAMTEEGLDQVVREYQAKPAYANEQIENLRFSLRWSPCDSPLHLEGEEHFEETNECMADIAHAIHKIDTDQGWDEFESFVGRFHDSICNVLKAIDIEGVFGTGQERERVFVTIMMGDQDDSILHLGKRLNPMATVKNFEKEWRDWGEAVR
jgi:hypothetical protein